MKPVRPAAVVALLLGEAMFGVPARGQSFEVAESSIAVQQKAMTERRVTSRALVQAYLNRIDAFDVHGPKLNSLILLNPRALEEADALDREIGRAHV